MIAIVLKHPVFRKVLLAGVLLWFFVGFLSTLRTWYDIVVYPGEVDFTEGIVLYEVNQLREGNNIYKDRNSEGFAAANFGPFFYILNAVVSSFRPDSYFPHRILSLFGVALMSSSFCFFIWSKTKSWIGVLFALTLSIWPFSIIVFGPTLKPDSLALGFLFIGLIIGLLRQESNAALWAIPFFVIAFFIKQTSLVAPSFIALVLFRKSYSLSIKFVLSGTVIALALFSVFCAYFGVQNFLDHFVVYNVMQSYSSKMQEKVSFWASYLFFLHEYWPLILLSIAAAMYSRSKFFLMYSFLSYAFFMWLMNKAGSYFNYWSEILLALLLPLPLAIAKLFQDHESRLNDWLLVILFVAFVFFDKQFYLYRHPVVGRVAPSSESIDREKSLQDALTRYFQGKKITKIYTSNPGLVAKYRKHIELYSDDPFLLTQQILKGNFDEKRLLQKINSRYFDLIILTSSDESMSSEYLRQKITSSQLEAIKRNYKIENKVKLSQYYYFFDRGNFPDLYAYFLLPMK